MVKPILLYCSDVWGTLKQPKNSPIERVHISFHKQLLGVRQQTPTDGVHLELGSFPITLNAIKAAVKNWERIRQYNCNDLLMATYEEATMDNLPWASSIRETFMSNGLLQTFLTAGSETRESECPHVLLFQRQRDQFNQEALGNIKESSKLQFYSLLKTEAGIERYLTYITNITHRTDLTRLRLSSHSLHIETGRHNSTPRENRKCTFCRTDAIEDETHFLIRCPIYQNIRTEHLPLRTQPDHRLDVDKAVRLLTSHNSEPVSKLVHELFKHRGIMSDSLTTLDNVIGKVEAILLDCQVWVILYSGQITIPPKVLERPSPTYKQVT